MRGGELKILTAAFGGDEAKARRWQHLWRQADSDLISRERAEKLDAEREALSATAKPGLDNIELADEPNLRALAKVFDDIERHPAEIPDILPRHLSDLPLSTKAPEAWSLPEARAVAIMRKAGWEIQAAGLDVRQISRELMDRYAGYFSDPKDAEFMIEALRASMTGKAEPEGRSVGAGRGADQLGAEQFAGDEISRVTADFQIKSGRHYVVREDTIAAAHAVMRHMDDMLPEGIAQATLARIEYHGKTVNPVDGKPDALVKAVFRGLDAGDEYGLPLLPWRVVKSYRGGFFPTHDLVAFFRYGPSKNFAQTLRGEIWHEFGHVLWRQLDDATRRRLIAHTVKLRVGDLAGR